MDDEGIYYMEDYEDEQQPIELTEEQIQEIVAREVVWETKLQCAFDVLAIFERYRLDLAE